MDPAEGIALVASYLGISPTMFEFPEFLFNLLIPFVLVTYVNFDFLKRLRIFHMSDLVNGILAFIITLVLLRFVYPILFVIAIGYMMFIWKARLGFTYGKIAIIAEVFVKLLILGILGFLYLYALPQLSSLTFQ